jgi:hypothetical protein
MIGWSASGVPVALWEAVRQGVGGRRFTFDGLFDQFLPGKYDPPNFALKLATKDVALATALRFFSRSGPIWPGCCSNIDGLPSRASISRTSRVPRLA